jgi:OOP family OmpA-OmpF porin
MKKPLILGLLLMTLCRMSYSQEDAEGCKDSPLFNRMPNTYITECSKNFDLMEIPLSDDRKDQMEGNQTTIHYTYNYESNVPPPSFYQIVKNHENALLKNGGKRIYYSKETGVATLFVKSGDKEIWIVLSDFGGIGEGQYGIMILEVEGMKQDISAGAMLEALNKNGSIALYINFETGKSEIKADSQKIVDDIAEMLKANPSLKISVEGHTDNVGTPAANKTLSENRGRSVMNALIAKGIDKSRITAKGWGQEKPISDNGTEEGKSKNRRVEIVKL